MKNFKIKELLLVTGVVFSAAVLAETITKPQYQAQEKSIAAEYKVAKTACDSLTGNAKDICVVEAKGKQRVSKADLEANYKPSAKSHHAAQVAKADADYAVANEKCDDKTGNDKDVCVKEAKAAKVSQIADADTQLKSAKANAQASEKSGEAKADAKATKTEARHDAATDKRDADYAVAKEKCDALAGNAKDTCLSEAKTRFGKY